MNYKILMVEDEENIFESVKEKAAVWNLEFYRPSDFQKVMDDYYKIQPHLVIMDINLPFFNGYHWCQEIRKISNVPILFLSSSNDNMNMIMGITIGGDDYIAKPFNSDYLITKIQALLRRTYDLSISLPMLECRGAVLDIGKNSIIYDGNTIDLTKNEFKILSLLMENKNSIVSRERIMDMLWESEAFIDDNTLTVNINRIRKKLSKYALDDFITTQFGVGYIIKD
ncbi:DNA-binding response regulator, OmpR family, contains REC and winged-helix (wHTH) domain [Lachnospiraceae bacterium KH1T2]|nr:DNA-binding response regulator, OmpR family, contains REC and winged-helix (wHTH) domain [Lachnospiraceae bacterium KH1T2]